MDNLEAIKSIFSERLRELLNGESILQFGKKIEIPERTINSWINKKVKPRLDYVVMLANYFDCSADSRFF